VELGETVQESETAPCEGKRQSLETGSATAERGQGRPFCGVALGYDRSSGGVVRI
jgi:hypothetical protein